MKGIIFIFFISISFLGEIECAYAQFKTDIEKERQELYNEFYVQDSLYFEYLHKGNLQINTVYDFIVELDALLCGLDDIWAKRPIYNDFYFNVILKKDSVVINRIELFLKMERHDALSKIKIEAGRLQEFVDDFSTKEITIKAKNEFENKGVKLFILTSDFKYLNEILDDNLFDDSSQIDELLTPFVQYNEKFIEECSKKHSSEKKYEPLIELYQR